MVDGFGSMRERALAWYRGNAGQLVRWPTSPDGLLLATRARGIYKPEGSPFALSVRENINSPYADRPPKYGPDGSWRYLYHQQGADTTRADGQWDDKSLYDCISAGLPVGVLRQVSAKPNSMYEVLGVAMVTDWLEGYFVLEGEASPRSVASAVVGLPGVSLTESLAAEAEADDWGDDPTVRDRVVATISRRRGQPAFRRMLLANYDQACAITACTAVPALEAAHISTVAGADLNIPRNGILLRADLHTLFDLGLIAVHDRDFTVLVSPEIQASEYGSLNGDPIRLPSREDATPDPHALRRHRVWAGL